MATKFINVTGQDSLSAAVSVHHVEYLRPVLLAVNEFGCSFGVVPSGSEAFEPATTQPYILLVGDDAAHGPSGFHQDSLRRYIGRCSAAVIVAVNEPPEQAYIAASAVAAVTRKDVLIVETRVSREGAWHRYIADANPDVAMTVWTAPATGMVQ